MPSPFPGIDPFLEDQGYWPDFHVSFITYWREALAQRLPDHYEARIDERVTLVEWPKDAARDIRPDVAILQREASSLEKVPSAMAATLEPVTIPLLIEEEAREAFIEIRRRPDRTLVAVLELLSPANKEEPGRGAYLAKRNTLLQQAVHLVELDLLLSGRRLPMRRPLPPGDYYAFISRGDQRPNCDVYAWTLRQTLPPIPIPLSMPDPDLVIDLGEVFATTYERGAYRRSVDYRAALTRTLDEASQNWVEQQVDASS